MAILEQVVRMKEQGLSEGDIITELSQQGVSPREISDALRQAQIKSAISGFGEEEASTEGMEQSVMPDENVPNPNDFNNQVYVPRTYEQEQYAPQETYTPAPMPSEYQQEQYYPQAEGYEQYGAGTDTNTVMEIADQIFSDRIRKIQKQVEDTAESSVLLQAKMENLSERLKKMETIIDKLQIAILEKVGSYGRNLEGVRKEMSMMQDSFSKMVSPRRAERESSEETNEEEPRKRVSRRK